MLTFTYELDSIDLAAQKIVEMAGKEKIWVFKGAMGAGKTTLIKALSKVYDVVDHVSSPTFGIVNEYVTKTGELIFHFDFYRLDDPKEALEIGIEEYFYSGRICWIEWAERIAQFLPDDFYLITIETETNTRRKITLQHSQNGY